jgi:hypothetical protein
MVWVVMGIIPVIVTWRAFRVMVIPPTPIPVRVVVKGCIMMPMACIMVTMMPRSCLPRFRQANSCYGTKDSKGKVCFNSHKFFPYNE